MASSLSSSSSSPETMINIKVKVDGTFKKLKLPLKDLSATTLPHKLLHESLKLPSDAKYLIERYSDSAASYVVLDPANQSVFKQLLRAAKAKQKLKLRVTAISPDNMDKQDDPVTPAEQRESPRSPARPVTVEDVPEATSDPTTATTSPKAPEPTPASEKTLPGYTEFGAPGNTTLSSILAIKPEPSEPTSPLDDAKTTAVDKVAEMLLRSTRPVESTASSGLTSFFEADPSVASPLRPPPSFVPQVSPQRLPFAVYCNRCNKTIPDTHYHCSTCDDGDFDLCQACIDMGVTCHGESHWLIKRMIRDGAIVTSTTERKPPKHQPADTLASWPSHHQWMQEMMAETEKKLQCPASRAPAPRVVPLFRNYLYPNVRTCNNCVQEFPELEFLHCTTCPDFDLCKSCFAKDDHGHHPRHPFTPAVEGCSLDSDISRRLAPGRNAKHNAICDGCDQYINGVRHKCVNCPDWDYCSGCFATAGVNHPHHRFMPIYEPLTDRVSFATMPTHFGVHCDGPLCTKRDTRFISGDRYKCAVCHDTDFCANCEASPLNTHNKTHPLIKFKTPVRNVNVTTTGERENGFKLPQMGDRPRSRVQPERVLATGIRTVVNVPPTTTDKPEPSPVEAPKAVASPKTQPIPIAKASEYCAVYERDTIADGTVMPSNHIFQQTWTLRNAGRYPWPAGCRLKYIGGDYMGHVDSNRPAAVPELISASESTVCYAPLAPGQSFTFTVLLRTPPRDGKFISYWRLSAPDGLKFGHRLWCDVDVKTPASIDETKTIEPEVKEEPKEEDVKPQVTAEKAPEAPAEQQKLDGSHMIFPKLDKESPVSSVHQEFEVKPQSTASEISQDAEDFEDCHEDDDWSEEGFMTDEEYDILDASDEEYVDEKKQARK